MERLSLIIAILSFAMSLTQWIYTLYKNRTHFSMSIERFEWYEYPEHNYNRSIDVYKRQILQRQPAHGDIRR